MYILIRIESLWNLLPPELNQNFPCRQVRTLEEEFTCPVIPWNKGRWQQGSIRHYRDLISGGSHEITVWHIILAERTSGLARVDGQYVLYMSAPALDVRRHISQPNLGRPRHGIQSVQGTWWFGRVRGGQMQMS